MDDIISKAVTYAIILLIYSAVLNVTRMIHSDIKSMNKKINDTEDFDEDRDAYLKLINLRRGVYFDVEESYLLQESQIIGRADNSDIAINDPFLSKRNTRIYSSDGEYYVEDLGGKNGTSLNGERLEREPEQLFSGDRVDIGQLGFIFINPNEENGDDDYDENN